MFTLILGVAGGCIVLAFLLYFLVPAKGVKASAVVLGTVGGLAVGGVLGMLAAVIYGDSVQGVVYSETYKPSPMPSGAPPKGSNVNPAPAPEKAKRDVGPEGGGRPGMPALPSDYPKAATTP